jgi:serine/threonine protein kinase
VPLLQPDSPSVQNEIRAIRKLCNNLNTNIIQVFDIGLFTDNRYTYVDMELCDLDLDQYMKSSRVVSLVHEHTPHFRELQICNIMMQISRGLAFIHGHQEVHRDIKPQNSIILNLKPSSHLNVVLYSCKHKAWKVADFGLTSEGNSQSLRSTEAPSGTPGYRPPELLQPEENLGKYQYNNKVDIWAMGCVLHELIVHEKPFSSDMAVFAYYQEGETVMIAVDRHFKSARTLSNAVRDMLQKSPQSRPSANALALRFSRSYKSIAIESAQLSISEDSVILDDDHGNKTLDTESFPSLRLFQPSNSLIVEGELAEVSNWTVDDAIVNKLNTRVVVCSRDDEQMHFRSRLFDTSSGELLSDKQEAWMEPNPHPTSTFSEDGKYLGVYFSQCVEVLDVYSKPPKIVQSCSIRDTFPDNSGIVQAIAITRNGKGIAISRAVRATVTGWPPPAYAMFAHQKYTSQHSATGQCGIDVINTIQLSNVALSYTPDGRCLYLFGFYRAKLGDDEHWKLVAYCWDTRSHRKLHETTLGTNVTLESHLTAMYIDDSPCIVFSLGQLSPVRVFVIYSCDGSVTGRYLTDGMIHVVTNSGVLFLKSDKYFKKWDESKQIWVPDRERRITGIEDDCRYLWKWDGMALEPECCGMIQWRSMPPVHKIKAISEAKNGLALILDDERLLYLTPKVG